MFNVELIKCPSTRVKNGVEQTCNGVMFGMVSNFRSGYMIGYCGKCSKFFLIDLATNKYREVDKAVFNPSTRTITKESV